MKRSFAVIGGDARQRCLLRQLRGLGFPASAYRVPDTEDSAPELSGTSYDTTAAELFSSMEVRQA